MVTGRTALRLPTPIGRFRTQRWLVAVQGNLQNLVDETITMTQLVRLLRRARPFVVTFPMTHTAHHLSRCRFSSGPNPFDSWSATAPSRQRRTDWNSDDLRHVNGVDPPTVHVLKRTDPAGQRNENSRVLVQRNHRRANVFARNHLLLRLPARTRQVVQIDDAELLLATAPLNLVHVLRVLNDSQHH